MQRALMFAHIYARSAKCHAFHFQSHALLERTLSAGLDLSARAEHAMPRKRSAALAQHRRHLPVPARISGRFCYLPISSDFAARNQRNRLLDRQFRLRCFSVHSRQLSE
jgi:hypothetical protein